MDTGATRPALIGFGGAGDTQIEVVAKFSAGCDVGAGGLVAEAVASMLAADLGLPTPQAYLVKISPAFIEAITDPDTKALASRSVPICFGSRRLPQGVRPWIKGPDSIPAGSFGLAADIFAFDVLIDNVDRRLQNSNLLLTGSQMWIYDHERAFHSHMLIGWKPPWVEGSLEYLRNPGPDQHVLFEDLQGKAVDLTRFQRAWEGLSDERLQAYGDAIPPEWYNDFGLRVRALAHIAAVRANIVPALAEVIRVLR